MPSLSLDQPSHFFENLCLALVKLPMALVMLPLTLVMLLLALVKLHLALIKLHLALVKLIISQNGSIRYSIIVRENIPPSDLHWLEPDAQAV